MKSPADLHGPRGFLMQSVRASCPAFVLSTRPPPGLPRLPLISLYGPVSRGPQCPEPHTDPLSIFCFAVSPVFSNPLFEQVDQVPQQRLPVLPDSISSRIFQYLQRRIDQKIYCFLHISFTLILH